MTNITTSLLQWYDQNMRPLPWRVKKPKPYHVWLSEIMLQQTQVPRVIGKYNEFLKKFPTVQALARAPLAKVLKVWSGLGYNRRALYLQKCAQIIKQKHNGKFPETTE